MRKITLLLYTPDCSTSPHGFIYKIRTPSGLFTNRYLQMYVATVRPTRTPYVLETCQMSSNALLQCVLPIVATFDSQTIPFTTIRPLSLCSGEIVADLQGEPCK
jgi:hypothetical protein